MKVENFLTGELINIHHATKLPNGEYVDSPNYHRLSRVLKKGLLDKADIIYGLDLERRLDKIITLLFLDIRKLSTTSKKPIPNIIEEVISRENTIAIEKYKKFRQALNKEEHIKVITKVIKSMFGDVHEKVIKNITHHTQQEHLDLYSFGIEHFRY